MSGRSSSAPSLPGGTVTFLFTDIEGSTRRAESLGDEAWTELLETHHRLLREAFETHRGVEVKTEGDAFFVAFERATDAVAAAVGCQRALESQLWAEGGELRVRMGLHTGEAIVREDDYIGHHVHRASRICDAAHGGQILVSEATAALVRDALPEEASIIELGSHRLKGLGSPHRLSQVRHPDLPSDFPPLRTLDARPNNLPVQRTTFIGRDDERGELVKAVPETQLVTLTGVGGTGKTRLALEVGAELVDAYSDGVWFVDLAAAREGRHVAEAIAAPLGVTGVPDLSDSLRSHLSHRRTLLILDNCEQVVAACAGLVDELLRACPDLRVLATSREALDLVGEEVLALDPLETPDPDEGLPLEALATFPSVRLLCDRAASANREFVLSRDNARDIAAICHRLDGIPLALELAAPRLRVLSPSELVARMDDRFGLLVSRDRTAVERQRTLRSLVDWSYDLLDPAARVLFRRLSLFAGGFSLDAVPSVCDVDEADVLDLLTSLTDKSLVTADTTSVPTRYGMLETIRAYAAEKLEEAEEDEALEAQHAEWYRDRVTRATAELHGPDQMRWLEELDADHDNLRKALAWTRSHDPEGLPRLAIDLVPFWERRGYAPEASRWLEAARRIGASLEGRLLVEEASFLRMQGDYKRARALLSEAWKDSDPRVRAEAGRGLGLLAFSQGEHDDARRLLTQSIAESKELGDAVGEAEALQRISQVVVVGGDYGSARRLCEQAIAILRRLDDRRGLAGALTDLGVIAYREGDLGGARERWRESLDRWRELGERARVVTPLLNLGTVAMATGDLDDAEAYYRDALAVARRTAEAFAEETCLHNLGILAEERGHLHRARSLLEESLDAARRLGSRTHVSAALRGLGRISSATGDHERAREWLLEGLEVARDIGAPLEIVQVLRDLVWVHLSTGAIGDAEEALAEASSLRRGLDLPSLEPELRSFEGLLARHRGDLERARALYEGSMSAFREQLAPKNLVWQLTLLGDLALAEGDPEEAERHFRDGLQILDGLTPGAEELLEGLAVCAAEAGRPVRASRLVGIAEALRERTGSVASQVFLATVSGAEERVLEALGREGLEEGRRRGGTMPDEEAYEYALATSE